MPTVTWVSSCLLECLEILLHVVRRVFLREPALVHQLLKSALDLADVLAVVLAELREARLISSLVAKTGSAVGNGVRIQRHIEISRTHAEVLEISPARSRPDSGLHLARAGGRPFDRGNVRHRSVGSGRQGRKRDG